MGAVTLSLQFGNLITPTKFFVIDADTSYKALLGRPWLHENKVVASTLHQCMKYVKDGKQRRINGDIKPFGVHEVSCNDARILLNKEEIAAIKARAAKQVHMTANDTYFSEGAKRQALMFRTKPVAKSSLSKNPDRLLVVKSRPRFMAHHLMKNLK